MGRVKPWLPKSLVSLEMSKPSGSPELNPLGEELGPFDEEETHMTEEEDPHDWPNLELNPLGGTPLRCRSCLRWGTSQVQPGVDCHGNDENDKNYGNAENVGDVEVTLPSQVREEQVESLLVLVVVVTTALVIIVINMMI